MFDRFKKKKELRAPSVPDEISSDEISRSVPLPMPEGDDPFSEKVLR
jgi:hypothetical protein